jgi:hypothetical protein
MENQEERSMLKHVGKRTLLNKQNAPACNQDGSLAEKFRTLDRKIGEIMETNPYQYDTAIQWIPQQKQLYEDRHGAAHTSQLRPPVSQNQRPQPGSGNQRPRPPEKMPKARALALAHKFKKWLAVASLISFGTFSGLVAFHQGSITTSSQASQTNKTSSGSSQATPTTSSSSQNSSSILNQQGGNNFGSSSSSQTPVSGTHTS